MPKILGVDEFIDGPLIVDGSVEQVDLAADVVGRQAPLGAVLMHTGDADAGNWLICDGRAVSRTLYAAYFALVGTRFGNGDGSTTFNIPDLRGRFVRGRDFAQGRDPNAATRTAMNTGGATGDAVGSLQGDQFRSHTHSITTSFGGADAGILPRGGIAFQQTNVRTDEVINAKGGAETRPINAALNFIVRVI